MGVNNCPGASINWSLLFCICYLKLKAKTSLHTIFLNYLLQQINEKICELVSKEITKKKLSEICLPK
jgi:hypothetical protein